MPSDSEAQTGNMASNTIEKQPAVESEKQPAVDQGDNGITPGSRRDSEHSSEDPIDIAKDDVHIDTGMSPEEEEKKKKEEEGNAGMAAYLKLWSYATPIDRVGHAIAFLSACGAGAALPLMTIVFGAMVNEFNKWGQVDSEGKPLVTNAEFESAINRNTLFFVYLFIGKFVLVYFHTTIFTITATRMTRSLRLEYVRSILRQEIAYFDTCTPGSVASKISTNANLIQTGLSEKVGVATQGLAMLVSAFIVAFTKQWKLTLVTATTLPAVIILVGITVAIDSKLEAAILDTYSKAGGLAEEALSSVRNVVAFAAHDKLRAKYEAFLDVARAKGIKKGPILGLQYSSEFSIMYCAYALSFWYGIKLYLNNEIDNGGVVVTVFFSCIIATSSLTVIAPSIGDFTKAAAAAKDVHEMIARIPTIDSSSPSGLKPETVTGRIEVRNISFKYPARPTIKVLDDVSIVFEERKTTALVGASGSGKSTIVALAERWYDPEEGQVLIDGHNLKDLNLRWARSQIGLVQQEPVLFNDTIYANVVRGLCGSPMANALSEDDKRQLVKDACKEANADSFIEQLPEAYDTLVGERAGLLSGGQKQRIAIARSIISNPPILLLDEATSALDPKAEGIVQAALDNAAKHRTTIMIAHRLSTVKKADKIVVLSKGKVIEEGTHESLIAAKGAYHKLVGAQNLSTLTEKTAEDASSNSSGGDSVNEGEGGGEGGEGAGTGIDRVETHRSAWSIGSAYKVDDPSKRLGLFKCLYIVMMENKKLWPWFLGGILGSIVGGLVFPAQAILFSRIVTVFQYTGSKLRSEGDFWSLMFFCLALATLFSYASMGFFWTTVAFIMGRTYRSEYFTALISQDIGFYDNPENSSGALTSRLSSDPQHVHDLIQGNIGLIFLVIINLVSSCTLSLAIGWRLSLVAIFGCLPPIFAAGFCRMRLELSSQERTSKFFLESTRFAAESVSAIRTVSSLTLESEVYDSYSTKLTGPVHKAYRRVAAVMVLFGLSESIDMLGSGFAFWYGARLLLKEQLDSKQFFLIFIAVVFGGQAAGFLFGFTTNMTKAHMASNHIIHLRSQRPAINASTGLPLPLASADTPAIEFRDVKFSYPTRPHAPVLRHLNLSIHHGQTIGLVGASGCGKTTVISLLERFYDISAGQLLINGTPLDKLDIAAWRASIALVAQEPVLYQGSVRDNITLGTGATDTDVTDAEVEAAARDANIHDFIMSLPAGYDTAVGSKGVALSGGQRQRLAIARALIRNPKVLLLDEATSALDTESEKVVQAAIEKASRGRTTIAVAHRLSTVKNADVIFVFAAGAVVEAGSHAELIARKGVYWEMCRGQSLDREVE